MAIKVIQETNSKDLKPYLSEFVKSLSKAELKKLLQGHDAVESAVKTKSKKGWILSTVFYSVFIWSKSKNEVALLECLDNPSFGFPLIKVRDSDGNFMLCFDDEIDFTLSGSEDNYFFVPQFPELKEDTEKDF